MPYIHSTRREAFAKKTMCMSTPGDLNYLLTQLCQEYKELKGESYSTYNDIIGALECCKQELYRKKVAPYENIKEWEHGTVWI